MTTSNHKEAFKEEITLFLLDISALNKDITNLHAAYKYNFCISVPKLQELKFIVSIIVCQAKAYAKLPHKLATIHFDISLVIH